MTTLGLLLPWAALRNGGHRSCSVGWVKLGRRRLGKRRWSLACGGAFVEGKRNLPTQVQHQSRLRARCSPTADELPLRFSRSPKVLHPTHKTLQFVWRPSLTPPPSLLSSFVVLDRKKKDKFLGYSQIQSIHLSEIDREQVRHIDWHARRRPKSIGVGWRTSASEVTHFPFLFFYFLPSPRSDDVVIIIIWCFFFFNFLSLPRGRFSSSSFGYDERRNEVLERAEGDWESKKKNSAAAPPPFLFFFPDPRVFVCASECVSLCLCLLWEEEEEEEVDFRSRRLSSRLDIHARGGDAHTHRHIQQEGITQRKTLAHLSPLHSILKSLDSLGLVYSFNSAHCLSSCCFASAVWEETKKTKQNRHPDIFTSGEKQISRLTHTQQNLKIKSQKKKKERKERGGSKVTPMLQLSSVVIDSLRLEGAGSSVSV